MDSIAVDKKMKQIMNIRVKPGYRRLIEAVPLRSIHNGTEYAKYLRVLEFCFDVLEDPKTSKEAKDALVEYAKALGLFIGDYEKERFHFAQVSQSEILKFLMEEHQLAQNDLSHELGGQSIVSNVLNNKRKLNAKQIARLSKRFHVSPATFFVES